MTGGNNQEDNLLLHAIQQGSKSAFNEIFRKYYPMLCAYSNRFVCLEDAEEIVQDVMVWLWRNCEIVLIESSLSSYLFKVVYHRTINKMIRNESKQRAETLFYEKTKNNHIDIDYCLIKELITHVEKAVAALPESYNEAFTMHRFLGMSYKDIAIKLNVSVKTIDYRIGRALKLLRKELMDFLPFLILFFY